MATFDMSDPQQRDARIALLMNRLDHSSAMDRVGVVEELKDIAKVCQKELGRLALPQLVAVVCRERELEVVQGVLEVLTGLATAGSDVSDKDALINAEYLLQDKALLARLLSLLQEGAMWIRLNAIELLNILATNRPEMLGDVILSVDAGFMKLIDVLEDRTEAVRNELLLLLLRLTAKNEQLQNFCAFNEVFDRLYQIMQEEGHISTSGSARNALGHNAKRSSGDSRHDSPIVADCLRIISNCLRKNQVARKMFMMSQCVQGLLALLEGNPPLPPKPLIPEVLAPEVTPSAASIFKGGQHSMYGGGRAQSASAIAAAEAEAATAAKAESETESRAEAEAAAAVAAAALAETNRPRSAVELLLELICCLLADAPAAAASAAAATGDEVAMETHRRAQKQAQEFQLSLCKMGYLACLCRLAFGHWVAGKGNDLRALRVHAIQAVGLLTAGNPGALSELDIVEVTTRMGSAKIPASTCLMTVCLREKDDAVRLAANTAFVHGIQGCPDACVGLIGRTMTPSPEMLGDFDAAPGTAPQSPGRMLINAMLTSTDRALANDQLALWAHWRCCRVVEIVLRGGLTCQELAIRVPAGPKFLLHRIVRLLSQAAKTGSPALQASLLRFLCVWLCDCPRAVTEVLSSPANLFLFDLAAGRTTGAVGNVGGFCGTADLNGVGPTATAPHPLVTGIACLLVGCCLLTAFAAAKDTGSKGKSKSKGKSTQVGSQEVLGLISQRVGLEQFQSAIDYIGSSADFSAAVRSDPLSLGASIQERKERGPPPFFDKTFVAFYRRVTPAIQKVIYSVFMGTENLGEGLPEDTEDLQMMVAQLKKMVRMQAEQLKESSPAGREAAVEEAKQIRLALQSQIDERDRQIAAMAADAETRDAENCNLVEDVQALSAAYNELEQRLLAAGEGDTATGPESAAVITEPLRRQIAQRDAVVAELRHAAAEEKLAYTALEEELSTTARKLADTAEQLQQREAQLLKMQTQVMAAQVASGEGTTKNMSASVGELAPASSSGEYGEDLAGLRTSLQTLRIEQADLLLLLANQEIEKAALESRLRAIGGDDALREARRATEEALHEISNSASSPSSTPAPTSSAFHSPSSSVAPEDGAGTVVASVRSSKLQEAPPGADAKGSMSAFGDAFADALFAEVADSLSGSCSLDSASPTPPGSPLTDNSKKMKKKKKKRRRRQKQNGSSLTRSIHSNGIN